VGRAGFRIDNSEILKKRSSIQLQSSDGKRAFVQPRIRQRQPYVVGLRIALWHNLLVILENSQFDQIITMAPTEASRGSGSLRELRNSIIRRTDSLLSPSAPRYDRDVRTGSLDTHWIDIEMMGDWIGLCDVDHGHECHRPLGLDPSTLGRPHLLIDLKKKCLIRAGLADRYACLSYVWGGAGTLKTQQDNLEGLMGQGSLDSLWNEIPRTIRDTMDLAEQLGIPYLVSEVRGYLLHFNTLE
jgi:hypothetical protein